MTIEIPTIEHNKRPLICVPLIGKTNEEIIKQALVAQASDADVIEWRVDHYKHVADVQAVLDVLSHIRTTLKSKVLLFTFRTIEEGGQQPLTLTEYKALCKTAAESGLIDWIDIELEKAEFLGRGFIQDIKAAKVKLILSNHDFERTPEDAVLILRIGIMNQFGADIGKLAMMPNHMQDVLRLMGIITKARGFNQLPLAIMSMGDLGKISRVSGSLTGSVFTFASLGEASAPGQIPVEHMRSYLDEFEIKRES
ncbi:3-dehydroquinate dehydratase, type I [Enterococcus sp. 8G7_MSG3316]|uniref:3-dehydroquinate dehydratase n=1 Tax=Candidatus Enterococcus testudinis TaxID=1834191 RepID=A0A242A8Y6_9ENTE|nr:type I 3-dehydroquinate dehydratase [Enterococcus sp. 8G7_MSG3316]OTN77191.1 3-dehydroquinate dehydratase, type I [Enterococcus sp. 8G7_MSG3316]